MDDQQTLISNLQYEKNELIKQLDSQSQKYQRDIANAKTSYNQKIDALNEELEKLRSDIEILLSDDNTIEELTASFDEIDGTDEESVNKRLQIMEEIVSQYEEEIIKKNDENTELKELLQNIENVSSGYFPNPHISSISTNVLYQNESNEVTITGSYFTPDTKIEIEHCEIENFEFISESKISFRAIAANVIDKESWISLNNGNSKTVTFANKFKIIPLLGKFIDLREYNSEVGAHIQMSPHLDYQQNEKGIYFTGSYYNGKNRWRAGVKVPGLNNALVWDRSEKKNISIIFRNNHSSLMLGIAGVDADLNNRYQYKQGEILAYFTSGQDFYGLYGCKGTQGSITAQNSPYKKFIGNSVKKVTFYGNGEPGQLIELSELPNDDPIYWTSKDYIVHSFEVSDKFKPCQEKLMVFASPQNTDASQFIAIIYE